MALVRFDNNPRITDEIFFEILTPDADGCFLANPVEVTNVKIFYLERNFLGDKFGTSTDVFPDSMLLAEFQNAKQIACEDPTPANIARAENLKQQLEDSALKTTTFFTNAGPTAIFGTDIDPAWLPGNEPDDNALTLIPIDAEGNTQFGHFGLTWRPEAAIREGDYIVCWTWTPLLAGESLSAHLPFFIAGDPGATTGIPNHRTPIGKYEALLERYLPELYQEVICEGDITPFVTDDLNLAVADGFTVIEDLATALIDLFDANAVTESLLVYLGNLFNLRLKSEDPTLWRRQIKQAIPLYKQKGTKAGLEGAFAQAGMKLKKCTRLWQVVSQYTWQEAFFATDSLSFELEKTIITPLDLDNFELSIKKEDDAPDNEFMSLGSEYVTFSTNPTTQVTTMTWVGNTLSIPLLLEEGDILRVLYQVEEVPNTTQQQLEDFIRTLPLMDQRFVINPDIEDSQPISGQEFVQDIPIFRDLIKNNTVTLGTFPLKNWNVRVIAEDDPLFDVVIPVRHPFAEDIVFGQIRTEFPYSENIYNMEEYNGSTRDSTNPCNIDKDFVEVCSSCLSSKFNLDLEVEKLSNTRIEEIFDIIQEYTPFHAQIQAINLASEFIEFIPSPVETIEKLVTYKLVDSWVAGEANDVFTRFISGGLTTNKVTRDELTDKMAVTPLLVGTGYSTRIALYSPDVLLDSLGVNDTSNVLEVLAPSPNAGIYSLSEEVNYTATVTGPVPEPVNSSMFTFNLANIILTNTGTSIAQDNKFPFTDDNVDYSLLGVKSIFDVDTDPDYTGGPWKILIPALSATAYEICNVFPDGSLTIVENGVTPLPSIDTSPVIYDLLDDSDVLIISSTTGDLFVEKRGRVDFNNPSIVNLNDLVFLGDLLEVSGTRYTVIELIEDPPNQFYIGEWDSGDAAGLSVDLLRPLVSEGTGLFDYSGLNLLTTVDYETTLPILNGVNGPTDPNLIPDGSAFKENYLVRLHDGTFYAISEIDGTTINLAGVDQNWKTLGAGGSSVVFKLVHFPFKTVEIDFTSFRKIDRSGTDLITTTTETATPLAMAALQQPAGAFVESIGQTEGITFEIEWNDGRTEKGKL